ncbi:MAG: Segregation and condensation protein B [Acidobacteria bacterium]|nr:Segregation and condensation protein B [Acidobacteriota bacterium]
MSEEKQQHEESALEAEDLNNDASNGERFDGESLAEILAEDELIEDEFLSTGDEDAASERIRIIASDETVSEAVIERSSELASESLNGTFVEASGEDEDEIRATREELKPVIESLLFVADEPLPFKQLCKVLGDVPEEDVKAALDELVADYESRGSGLEVREIAGGWRISTRPQHHEFIRKYLKSRPSARLSLPALETLAVIAYKQPITIPEILDIRGVTSSSAIKTLLEKRLIVTKGRKETVGRPMMYGTSKEFMIQFGLKDLTELPSIEDFEDFAQ